MSMSIHHQVLSNQPYDLPFGQSRRRSSTRFPSSRSLASLPLLQIWTMEERESICFRRGKKIQSFRTWNL